MSIRKEIMLLLLMIVYQTPAFSWGKKSSAPSDMTRFLGCPLEAKSATGVLVGKQGHWTSYKDLDFRKPSWWKSFSKDLKILSTHFPKETFNVTVIDIKKLKNGHYGFRYLGNGNSHVLVSPWSSSKWLSALNAIRKLRAHGLTANSMIGSYHIGDLITTSHTGFETPTVRGVTSNFIGTLFANLGGRLSQDQLVREWLGRPQESFGGSYGGKGIPTIQNCSDRTNGKRASLKLSSSGRKRSRISTLSFAEALKRVATHHDSWNNVKFPLIQEEDLKILFYGHPDRDPGGMMVGFEEAIRPAFGGKNKLDQLTKGKWRIYSKTGSAHWVTGKEQLINAIVCLPNIGGGHFFAVSMHVKGKVRGLGLKRLKQGFNKLSRIMVPEVMTNL